MKAKIVEIQSRSYKMIDKPQPYRTIAIQFDLPFVQGGAQILRLPESCLGIIGIALDDEIEVRFDIKRPSILSGESTEIETNKVERDEPQPTVKEKEEK